MNKEIQIVSKLRFPEFNEKWGFDELQNLSHRVMVGIASAATHAYRDSGVILFRNQNIKDEGLDVSNILYIDEDYEKAHKNKRLKGGDLLTARTGYPGTTSVVPSEYKGAQSFTTLITRPKNKLINSFFLCYYINSEQGQAFFEATKIGGGQKNVNAGSLSVMPIPFPSLKEQQKIANCLSALDSLITAETEKLVNLKDHKKGLLQQLFPAKGETKPQFRFLEFINDGDWEEATLGDVSYYENGKAHEKEISATGKYKVVNSKFISTEGRVVKFTDSANLKANVGDILMVLSDIPNGKAIAKCFYVDKEDTYTVNQRICKITPTDIDNKFLFYIQNRNSYFLAFDDGVKQTNLRKDTVLSFPFLKPKAPKEQQKIASCLSSADDLIEAQKIKIKTLKKHKKGLMQKLFPNVNELAV
ncbi:restriction endonuclease subunit S [Algibacter sp. L1A34]|uniref:restriction endonuclease subunit S n=1 Tax=Algibacter sp. L1A34 TaxID=2686365 RepID=UPI00131C316F|nr:restriction endonuclease subunit S [Algibacter sp. L1A34]